MSRPIARALAAAGVALLVSAAALAEEAPAPPHHKYSENDRLDDIVRQFLAEYTAWAPSQATALGLHDRDASLEDRGRLAIEDWEKELNSYRHALQTVIEVNLDAEHLLDLRAFRHLVQRELFEHTELRTWERNPMCYTEILSSAAYELAAKPFARPEERLRSLIAREAQFARLLSQAKANLDNPPEVFTRKAIETARGTMTYLERQLPAITNEVLDDSISAVFLDGNARAIAALGDFVEYLETDLLPRSRGDFALGATRFAALLRVGGEFNAEPSAILALGEKELDRTLKQIKNAAKAVPGKGGPAEKLRALEAARPSADSVVAAADSVLAALREFVVRKDLVTIPPGTCRVAPMPPFMWGFAAMNAPGPFETAETDAFYFVRMSDGNSDPTREVGRLGLFNPWNLSVVSIHECYPGHFVQGLVMRGIPSSLRKVGWDYANTEGWAHYAEQMMLDEGFGAEDPRYRLSQLRESLVRLCRLVAAVRMHTKGMTLEQAARLFEKKAFLEPAAAREEAERGAFDPGYVNYALGKIAILKLREDWKAAHPADYSARAFHDRFLSFGPIPIPMIRAEMLGTQSGAIF